MNVDDDRRVTFGRVLSGSAMIMAVGGIIVAIVVDRWEVAWLTLSPVNATVGLGFGGLAWTVLPVS